MKSLIPGESPKPDKVSKNVESMAISLKSEMNFRNLETILKHIY